MNSPRKIAFAATMLCACGATSAQQYHPSWYIHPSLNAMKPDSDFAVDKHGYGAGLRFGKPLADAWDIQFGDATTSAIGAF